MKIKLKTLMESFERSTKEMDDSTFLESVKNFSSIGKNIYRKGSLAEVAQQLSEIADWANAHAIRETRDKFDKITVGRNMNELKGYAKQFSKYAMEAQTLQERIEALYEDCGLILNRYYQIDEAESGGKEEYQKFFRKACDKFGISPEDINTVSDEKKKKLFNWIDKNWKADKETD